MNKIRKIRRGPMAIDLLSQARNVMAHSEDTYFQGRPANPIDYKGENWLVKDYNLMARPRGGSYIYENAPGKYTLHIHSNQWAEFEGPTIPELMARRRR